MTRLIVSIFLVVACLVGNAQIWKESKLYGSVESNSHYYTADDNINFELPSDAFATNNYIKLNYEYKFIEAAIQYENYLPPLLGYSQKLEGHRLSHRYLNLRFTKHQFTAGHFYEQFGNGLALRTYEDRALGINTSLDGVRYIFEPSQSVRFKAFAAKQLEYKKNGEATIFGGNFTGDLSQLLFEDENIQLQTELSWVLKRDELPDDNLHSELYPETVSAYSGGLNFSAGDFSISGEYVLKTFDPSQINGQEDENGEGVYISSAYSKKGFGLNLIVRKLSNMDFRSASNSTGNVSMLNYIPANSKQHNYSLATLHPYAAQAKNELSWQGDFFYFIPKKTKLGGKYGTKLSLNFSQQFYSFSPEKSLDELVNSENMVYRDINLEIDRKWSRKFKSTISYIGLNMENYFLIPDNDIQQSNTFVGDFQYKIKPKKTIRFIGQHLFADDQDKNWYAWEVEYSVAPRWSVFISDMTNYGLEKIHYLNGGLQLKVKSSNFRLNYGRNREGYKCSGGICQWMPAYTGLGFSFTTNF